MNTLIFYKIKSFSYRLIFLIHYIYKPLPHTKNKYREPQFYYQAPMFPLVHLHVSHQFLISLEEMPTGMCAQWFSFFGWSLSQLKRNILNIHCAGFLPSGICMFKFNNRNTRTRCEICSKSIIKTPERRSGIFNVDFEHVSHLVLVFLLLTLSVFATGMLIILTMKTFSWRFDFYNSGNPSLLTMQKSRIQAVLMLLLKKKF